MKKNKKNKGFSAFEVLVVIVLYALVFGVIALVGIHSANKTKFKALKFDAIAFMKNTNTYITYSGAYNQNKIYLEDIVGYDDSYAITSPFEKNSTCDLRDSYIAIENKKMKVTLKCDDYMLYDALEDDINNGKYDVYYVTSWQEDKPSIEENEVIDEQVFYNYKKNGDYVFKEFLPMEMFINKYNEKENKDFLSVDAIKSYEKKTYYRKRKVVSNVVD